MRWRLYYGDGTTYSDRDGSPYDAPPANLQVVAREAPTPTGFELVHGTDAHYWHVGLGMWQGCDVPGLWDHLLLHRGPKVVLERFGFFLRLYACGKYGSQQEYKAKPF